MAMAKIKNGDTVVVLVGKDSGKVGIVTSVLENKVIVEGLNLATYFVKRDPNNNEEGGVRKKEMPIHISNVSYYDEKLKKAIKIGIKTLPNGKKIRYNKASNEQVDENDSKTAV